MKKYRVTIKRWDDRPEITHFEAETDEDALEKFNKDFKNSQWYEWDNLILERIDVHEKTSYIDSRFISHPNRVDL